MTNNNNNYENLKLRGLKRKYEIIMGRGGKCERCGYSENLAALEFHHTNPSEKEFQIDIRHFANTNIETLQKELDKCELLCANCHREVHNLDLALSKIPAIIDDCNKSSFKDLKGLICPVCGKRFPKTTGKIYCSPECREKDKHYPSKELVNELYEVLKSWEKVAQHFGLTRKIIQGIRKDNS